MIQIEIYLLAFILCDVIIQKTLVHGNVENTVSDDTRAKKCVSRKHSGN